MTAEALSDAGQAGIEPLGNEPGGMAFMDADAEIKVWMSAQGIIRLKLPEHAAVTGAQAQNASLRVRMLAGGRFFPILMDVTGVISVSRQARDVYNRAKTGRAYALLGRSPVDRVMAHYFLGSGSPDRPAAYFTVEAEAVAWLEALHHDG